MILVLGDFRNMKTLEFLIPFMLGFLISIILLGNTLDYQSKIIEDLTGKIFYSYEDYRFYKLENKGE